MSRHEVLNSIDHGELRVRVGDGMDHADAVMASLTFPEEFRQVQGHFPIVFRRDTATGKFAALALFGFEVGENLFLEQGRWNARYRPLAMAIQPFLVGLPQGGEGDAQVHVDMDHPRISPDGAGTRVFDEDGRPTPYLEQIAAQLGGLDIGYRQSPSFFEALDRHGLIEPFTLEVKLDDGSANNLVGFHTIDEDRLAALDGDALAALMADGHLLPIYMVLASLTRFAELVARKNARLGGG